MTIQTKHKALVQRTNARGTKYYAAIGPWRDNPDAARKDADAHRLETNPVARIKICSLTTADYNG